jgi:hypothetical protein
MIRKDESMKTIRGNRIFKSFYKATVLANENNNSENNLLNTDCVNIILDTVSTTSANSILTSDAVVRTSGAIRLTMNGGLHTSDAMRRIIAAARRTTNALRRTTDAVRLTCANVRLFKENGNFFYFSDESITNGNKHFSVYQSVSSFFTQNT